MTGLFGQLGISASGMVAERLRMQVIAENLANANSTQGADGQPYRRKAVTLQEAERRRASATCSAGWRRPASSRTPGPGRRVYDPANPDADGQGYVTLPNVDTVTEMVDLITASRGYDANAQALNAAKQMFTKALDILR